MGIDVIMRGEGDMKKSVYDPDADGVIAVDQTEAKGDMLKSDYDPDEDGVIATAQTQADMEKSIYDTDADGRIDNKSRKKTTVVVSDNLIGSSNSNAYHDGNTYTKIKELTLSLGSDISVKTNVPLRIKFSIWVYEGTGTAYAKIYRNDSPVGTERSNDTSTPVEYSEDIDNWNDGDKIQIYAKCDASPHKAYVKNFRIYATISYVDKDETLTAT